MVVDPAPGLASCRGVAGYAGAFEGRRTFLWRPEWLRARKRLFASDAAARAELVQAADAAMRAAPLSVHDKTALPASGDKGDYYSIGPYWWPDPTKVDGLPYVRRDGRVNPERDGERFDHDRLGRFTAHVARLALTSYYLDDSRYARRAALLLRVWFLDPRTRMNPNLNFGQAVPGLAAGRAEGLIDLTELGGVIDAIGLIEPTGALGQRDLAGLRDWFRRFSAWMTDSEIGRDERGRSNNHALFYDYMLTHFALFAGRKDVATGVVRAFPGRFFSQLDRNGTLPEELARTRSWHYSIFALSAAVRMATIGECVGQDLWSARAEDGRGLKLALDALLPYQTAGKRWPYRDWTLDRGIVPPATGAALFQMAAWGSGRPDYSRAAGPGGSLPLWLARYGNGSTRIRP